MMNMVKADMYRTFKNISIYIAFGIMLFMMGISLYMCEPGSIVTTGSSVVANENQALENPLDTLTLDEYSEMTTGERRDYVKKTSGYELDRDIMGRNMNLYYVFIFAAVIVITADFSSKTVKNTLSSAIGRGKYFISKTTAVFALCLMIFFANAYLTYFLNLLMNGKNISSDLWTITRTVLLQLPVVLAVAAILTGFAFMLKRTVLFNAVAIPFAMVCQLALMFIIKLFGLSEDLMNYDFQCMIKIFAGTPTESYIAKCYILCGALCVAFLSAGWLSFRKAEIK